jgi:hypothetical protein
MSLRGRNEKIEHLGYWIGMWYKIPKYKIKSHSRKYLKKVRNRLVRRNKNFEINPKLNEYNGYEY